MRAAVMLALVIALPLITILAIYLGARLAYYKRLVGGLDEPELWLPRSERREHARYRLKREKSREMIEDQEAVDDYLRRTYGKDSEELAAEAERGYDPEQMKPHHRREQ